MNIIFAHLVLELLSTFFNDDTNEMKTLITKSVNSSSRAALYTSIGGVSAIFWNMSITKLNVPLDRYSINTFTFLTFVLDLGMTYATCL